MVSAIHSKYVFLVHAKPNHTEALKQALQENGIVAFSAHARKELPSIQVPGDLTEDIRDLADFNRKSLWEITHELIPKGGLITQSSNRAGNQTEKGGVLLSSQAEGIFEEKKPQFKVGALPMHVDGPADPEAAMNSDGTYQNRVQLLVLHCYIPSFRGGENRLIKGVEAFQLLQDKLSPEELIQLSNTPMNATRDGLGYPYIPLSLTSQQEFARLNWTFIVDEITRKKPLFKKVNKLLNNNRYISQLGLSSGQGLAMVNQGVNGFLHARRGFPIGCIREHEKIWSRTLPWQI